MTGEQTYNVLMSIGIISIGFMGILFLSAWLAGRIHNG